MPRSPALKPNKRNASDDSMEIDVSLQSSSPVLSTACRFVECLPTDVQVTLSALNSQDEGTCAVCFEGLGKFPALECVGEKGYVVPSVIGDVEPVADDVPLPDGDIDAPGFDLPDSIEESKEPQSAPDRLGARLEKSLFKHRLEGHAVYHPSCDICKAARGIHHHRKRHVDLTETCELVADFGYYPLPNGSNMKFLTIVEPMSNAVTFVHCGMNTDKTANGIKKFIQSVGFSSDMAQCKVLVKTDDDNSLARLFRSTNCVVEKAGPQSHETIGLAERFNRVFKEHMAVLRLQLQSHGLDIQFTEIAMHYVFGYLSWTINQFKRPHGGELTAHEILTGNKRSRPTRSLFGALNL